MQYILLVASFLLYLFSPGSYSLPYCVLAMALFICTFLLLYKKDKMGFNLFFSIAFWSVTFIFPIFIYSLNPNYGLFQYGYNPAVITKATCLAQLAYSIYSVGYLFKEKKTFQYKDNNGLYISEKMIRYCVIATIALFLLISLGGGFSYYSSQYIIGESGTAATIYKYLLLLLETMALFLAIVMGVGSSKKYRNVIVVIIIVIALSYILAGARTFPIAIMLIVFYVRLANRIKPWQLLLLIMAGILFLSLVGAVRDNGVSAEGMMAEASSQREWYDFLLDMIVTNRNLYDMYDFVQTKSIMYGLVFMSNILAVIPFAQGAFCQIFGVPPYMMGSATFVTVNMLGEDSTLGLGTHVVGDIYLGAGIIGVFIFFFLLGRLVFHSSMRMKQGDIRWMAVYLLLLSDSVFMCRGSMFEVLRPIIWMQVLLLLVGTKK